MATTAQDIQTLFNLISPNRLRESTREDRDNVLMATESDKSRVINAASFRRLQQKAQVFPLETNASVRSRLTHSIEVSQVGRYLAQEIIRNIIDTYDLKEIFQIDDAEKNNTIYEKLASFSNIIESACLLHDIGNPPFGHLGEAAIQKWFNDQNTIFGEERYRYLPFFDGNAQGLRLVTFLSGHDIYGLNLTCSTLLAMIKYPKELGQEEKKYKGIYGNDIRFCYQKSCDSLQWPSKKIFPFALLMEAADDIAYCTSDLEDGLEKGIIKEKQLYNEFSDLYEEVNDNESFNLARFIKFKTNIINKSVSEVAKNFIDNLSEILNPNSTQKVELLNSQKIVLDKIKKFARANIYSDSKVEAIELAGYNIISGLLDSYALLFKLENDEFEKIITEEKNSFPFEERLLKSIPKTYRDKYLLAKNHFTEYPNESAIDSKFLEPNLRAQMVVDFISGMTDDYALEKYQILKGISL